MVNEIEEQIRGFIVETFLFGEGGDELANDDSLLDRGIIDSTGVLELIAYVENSFGVKAVDEELVPDNFDSIRRLAAFIVRKQGDSHG